MKRVPEAQTKRARSPIDVSMLLGVAIAAGAVLAGLLAAGVRLRYFFQPTGAAIVLGGTFGVIFITTPRSNLANTARRALGLLRPVEANRGALIEEMLALLKLARSRGLLTIEASIQESTHPFLKDALTLCLDAQDQDELRATLETKVRLRERQGEMDAKVLEVAGGFAPAIGVLGTVVGLIQVLGSFSDLAPVASGIGAAFVSTIYGLGLANLLLLPAAHRIRARVAEAFETHELILEGVMCMAQGLHPALARDRLNAFLRESE